MLNSTSKTTGAGNSILASIARSDFFGDNDDNAITGGASSDRLYGFGGDDHLIGLDGDDLLSGAIGNDLLEGGTGNDFYFFDQAWGQDQINDDHGRDTVFFAGTVNQNLNIDLFMGTAYDDSGNTLTFTPAVFTNAYGGSGKDLIVGNDLDNYLSGQGGADRLEGRNGNDQLFGDQGDDILLGGSGNDQLRGGDGNNQIEGGIGNDILYGGSGDDTYVYRRNWGNDRIEDTQGSNALVFDLSGIMGLNINLLKGLGRDQVGNMIDLSKAVIKKVSGTASNDRLLGDDLDNFIEGNDGDDWIGGADGNDQISGGNGNDKLDGWAGGDTVSGGSGNDILVAGAGDDQLYGGDGDDYYWFDNRFGSDLVYETSGNDTFFFAVNFDLEINLQDGKVFADNGYSVLVKAGQIENAFGGEGADQIIGNNVANYLSGGDGDDQIFGLAGNDRLFGGNGDDLLDGGSGNNILKGGNGDDTYYLNNPADQASELNAPNSHQVVAFGDSHTVGLGASNTNSSYIGILRNGLGWSIDNRAISGQTFIEQIQQKIIYEPISGNTDYIINAGYNDVTQVGLNAAPKLEGQISFAIANLAIPDSLKVFGNNAQQTGDWSQGKEWFKGVTTTINGASLTFQVTGDHIYLSTYTYDQSDGQFRVWIDGEDQGLFSAGEDFTPTYNGINYYPDLIKFEGLDDGNHIVTIEKISGTDPRGLTINWVAGFDDDTIGDQSSDILVAGLFRDNDWASSTRGPWIYGSDQAVYDVNAVYQSVVSDFQKDGLKVSFVDLDAIFDPARDSNGGNPGADNIHPNNQGHAKIAEAFIEEVSEASVGGEDTIHSRFSYVLGTNFENLILDGSANIDGTGNVLDNLIQGNSGDNILDGKGGSDTLLGGDGDDLYRIKINPALTDYVTVNDSIGDQDKLAFYDPVQGDPKIANAQNWSWRAIDSIADADNNFDSLRINLHDGLVLTIENFFDNLTNSIQDLQSAEHFGTGLIEQFNFQDGIKQADEILGWLSA
ncbi:MAG: hypothetical protein SFT81_02185 [Candidatus Caenarcaniphilales bacterium]|nr:hypothetical protein [Candidatus Caenarcaniphilales bacterium]